MNYSSASYLSVLRAIFYLCQRQIQAAPSGKQFMKWPINFVPPTSVMKIVISTSAIVNLVGNTA